MLEKKKDLVFLAGATNLFCRTKIKWDWALSPLRVSFAKKQMSTPCLKRNFLKQLNKPDRYENEQ